MTSRTALASITLALALGACTGGGGEPQPPGPDAGRDAGPVDPTDSGPVDPSPDAAPEPASDAGTDAGPVIEADAGPCAGLTLCDEASTRCDGVTLVTCAADESGCLVERREDCGADTSGASCEEAGESARCVAPGSLYSRDSVIAGRTYAEWAAAWWQWAYSIPRSTNPTRDGDCTQQQPDDVWFLAGNYGGESHRTCTVPADRPLFFPVINAICHNAPDIVNDDGTPWCDYARDTAELEACAEAAGMSVRVATAELDGVEIPGVFDHTTRSASFSWEPPDGVEPSDYLSPYVAPIDENMCGFDAGPRNGMTHGRWLMLRPLAPGSHTLRFRGTSESPVPGRPPFMLDVTYELTVEG